MSLILEALRKSEAERRRGQAPNLHAELAPAAQPVRSTRPSWQWPALAIVAVAAMAWLGLVAWSSPPAVELSTEKVDQSAASDAVVVADEGDAGLANRDAASATTSAEAPPPLLDPPNRNGTPSPLRPNDTTPNSSLASADNPPPRPADTAAPPPRDPIAMADRVAQPITPPAAADLPRPVPQSPPAIATAVPATTVPVASPPAARDAPAAAPLRLAELSAAERLELPALKMSMHMWGPTTGERFAIIDGARLNEGDRLGDAIVEEITARAVVLAWRGKRLQIPVR